MRADSASYTEIGSGLLTGLGWGLAGVMMLLVGLAGVKGAFGFSWTNFTLLLFLPIGPITAGWVLGVFYSQVANTPAGAANPSIHLLQIFVLGTLLFVGDQYIAFVFDARSGWSFGEWYNYVVENRNTTVSYRGRRPQEIEGEGGLGYLFEMIKLGAIYWAAWRALTAHLADRHPSGAAGSGSLAQTRPFTTREKVIILGGLALFVVVLILFVLLLIHLDG